MRITIWDMDWHYKKTKIPNYKAMKISSYHKQLGHYVNFIGDEVDLGFDYDKMYIIKEKGITPFPPSLYIDRLDVKMIGDDFDFYDNKWETTAAIDMCRPDYTLYPVEDKDPYGNAHVVQFLHNGKYLPMKQDYINLAEKHHRKTLVVDDLWKLNKETILKIFQELKILKNIAFLKPIDLNFILSDKEITESFLKLHFSQGTRFNFVNNYSQTFEEVKKIIDVMAGIRKNKNIKIKGIKVKAVIYDHWEDKENAVKDLERCLKITDYAKERKVRILLETPKERSETPYWVFFDIMDVWTKYTYSISYVEAMLKSATEKYNKHWSDILNTPKKWSTPRANFLVFLMSYYPEMVVKYGIRKWGDEKINANTIQWENVLKYRNYQERDGAMDYIKEKILKETGG